MLAKYGTLKPSFSIVFYQQNDSFAPVATMHTIEDGEMGAGRIVSANEIVKIVQSDSNKHTNALLPPNTVAVTKKSYFFYRPSSYQTMYFRLHGMKAVRLTRRIPALIWMVGLNGRSISVFAVKGNHLPEADTQLYVPPFMNCTDSAICWGSAVPKLKGKPVALWPEIIEDTFFNHSAFTHTGNSSTLSISGKPVNDDAKVYKWWKSQPERTNRFKGSALIPLKYSLKEICNVSV